MKFERINKNILFQNMNEMQYASSNWRYANQSTNNSTIIPKNVK